MPWYRVKVGPEGHKRHGEEQCKCLGLLIDGSRYRSLSAGEGIEIDGQGHVDASGTTPAHGLKGALKRRKCG